MMLVMGATGRMGGAVARALDGRVPIRAGTSDPGRYEGPGEPVRFRLDDDEETLLRSLSGCQSIFVMRPPQITRRAPFVRLMALTRKAGLARVLVGSVMGAEKNPVLPHRRMEQAATGSGLDWTILRPADFMQNFETVHRDDIAENHEIAVPAGNGRSAMIDVADIGSAVKALLLEEKGSKQAYTLTGPEAVAMEDAAGVFSAVLPFQVRYRSLGHLAFVSKKTKEGMPAAQACVASAVYAIQRLGLASEVTPGIVDLTGRPAGDLRAYVEREKRAWMQDGRT